MNLFIKLKNNLPFEHPITEENMRSAFPEVNLDNPLPLFAPFQRISQPTLKFFEVCDGCTYVFDGEVVKDSWSTRSMTEEEKLQKLNKFELNKPYPSWTLNTDIGLWEAPTPMPNDGKEYVWDEMTKLWNKVNLEV